jgi:hypothetical protein|tara:strand:- start:299 stop:595 length:297 start_codon:yes stop_codon:yes gene_type:complete
VKVGDLVTLSVRAQDLYSLAPWCPRRRLKEGKHPAVVGLVVGVKVSEKYWERGKELFYVEWINHDGPPSREGKSGRYRTQSERCFWRTDLKFAYKRVP